VAGTVLIVTHVPFSTVYLAPGINYTPSSCSVNRTSFIG